MKTNSDAIRPDLDELVRLFPPADFTNCEIVNASEVPNPYHGLLVHEHHMTVTVEAFYGSRVDVRVLAKRQNEDAYARKILLELQSSRRVVQYGIVRIDFRYCDEAVRDEILRGKTPLGRILIEHDVLRRIEPTAYLRISPAPAMMKWFDLEKPISTFGRLAIIHCNEQPAVELLEIVAPVRRAIPPVS